jgi:hypothetical protein
MTNSEPLTAKGLKFTHRLLAWGVLGLATGGCLFSLLTLLFSGAVTMKTQLCRESFGSSPIFSRCFLTRYLPAS